MTAFVRDKAKLGAVTPQHVIEGDVLNKDNVDQAVQNQDGVIVVLGTRNDLSIYLYFLIIVINLFNFFVCLHISL